MTLDIKMSVGGFSTIVAMAASVEVAKTTSAFKRW
jgi:hypothetical protein